MTALARVETLRCTPVSLPLRRPWMTSRGTTLAREGFVLALRSEEGSVGVADCLPLPGFGLESAEAARGALARGLAALDGAPTLDAALDRIDAALPAAPAARASLDVALHDLAARARGAAVTSLWGEGAGPKPPPVSALLSATTPESIALEAKQRLAEGFRTLKAKLGVGSVRDDLARSQALRAAVGPAVRLRFDANRAWSTAQARQALCGLAALDPEYVEEPLRSPTPEALARLRRETGVPLAADESLCDVALARALVAARAVDVWVLKPAALGGLRAARRMAGLAGSAGLATVVTSFADAAPGRAAALQLAATLAADVALDARAAGLATDALLGCDVAELPEIRDGEQPLPDAPGLGVALDPARLEAVRSGPCTELRLP